MSSFYVSFEVWKNGRRAAIRFNELVSRVNTLYEELSKVAELWQKARDQYGEEFPAWSYGDTEVPASFRDLVNSDLAERVAKVQNAIRIYGSTAVATRDDLKSVARDVGELESVFRDLANSDLAERVAKAQMDYVLFGMRIKVRTSLQAASQLQATDTQAAVSSAKEEEEEAQREERERHRYAEEVSRLLGTLAAEVSHDDRTAIEQRAQEAVESPQAARRRALLAQLRLDIQRANKAGRARQRMVAQAEQWRDRLLGLEGPEVEQLGRSVAADCRWGGAAAAGHGAKGRRRRGAGDRGIQSRLCAGVITDELENLGYVVEVGFETAAAQAPEMLLHKPDMEDDYHVSLRVEAGALHNRVVREASDASDRSTERERTDEQMERTWCQDLATALAAAEHRGIRGRAVSRNPQARCPYRSLRP